MLEYVEHPGSRFRDRFDPKVADWILPYYEPAPQFDVAILGVPLSRASISHSAAFRLPDAIRAAFQGMTPYSIDHQLALNEILCAVDLGNVRMHVTDVAINHRMIEAAVKAYWQTHEEPLIILGGDHSITGASVLGLSHATDKRIGIIHFDAHHDVRNLDDGGRTNGTPFRTILSSGRVRGEKMVQIGLRDFVNAKAYHEYVLEHKVTVLTARQVFKEGITSIVERALDIAGRETDIIYVSFDLDVLDPSFVPGVPAPSSGGLTVWDAIEALELLALEPKVKALDVVCADPSQDVRDLTTRVAANLIATFMAGMALAKRKQA